MLALKLKGCPRCRGDLYVETDGDDAAAKCFKCSRLFPLAMMRQAPPWEPVALIRKRPVSQPQVGDARHLTARPFSRRARRFRIQYGR